MEHVVSFSVDASLVEAFVQAAKKNSCDDNELLKGFMAEYVQREIRSQQYEAWFKAKVEKGLQQMREGNLLSEEEAEARIAAFTTIHSVTDNSEPPCEVAMDSTGP